MTPQPNRKSNDTTVTSKRHTMQKRARSTIRVDVDLWQQFIRKTRSHHLSTCLALEGLMSAYVYGGSVVPGQTGPQVVNVTIEREEMRPRRREDEEYVRKKKEKTNHYDTQRGWYYDATLEPGEIVVDLPRTWVGEEKGFIWVEGRQVWWKKE